MPAADGNPPRHLFRQFITVTPSGGRRLRIPPAECSHRYPSLCRRRPQTFRRPKRGRVENARCLAPRRLQSRADLSHLREQPLPAVTLLKVSRRCRFARVVAFDGRPNVCRERQGTPRRPSFGRIGNNPARSAQIRLPAGSKCRIMHCLSRDAALRAVAPHSVNTKTVQRWRNCREGDLDRAAGDGAGSRPGGDELRRRRDQGQLTFFRDCHLDNWPSWRRAPPRAERYSLGPIRLGWIAASHSPADRPASGRAPAAVQRGSLGRERRRPH